MRAQKQNKLFKDKTRNGHLEEYAERQRGRVSNESLYVFV